MSRCTSFLTRRRFLTSCYPEIELSTHTLTVRMATQRSPTSSRSIACLAQFCSIPITTRFGWPTRSIMLARQIVFRRVSLTCSSLPKRLTSMCSTAWTSWRTKSYSKTSSLASAMVFCITISSTGASETLAPKTWVSYSSELLVSQNDSECIFVKSFVLLKSSSR